MKGIRKDVLLKAKQYLNANNRPDDLPERQDEMLEIQAHVESALEERKGSCIYVSGVPGTGKTLSVTSVIETIQSASSGSDGTDATDREFIYTYINGMTLTDPSYAYVQLWNAIAPLRVTSKNQKLQKKVSPSMAEELLEGYFKASSKRRSTSIVAVLDELDLMFNARQSVIYNFFNWPALKNSNLIVIAIANTMDLPERALSNKISSRLGLNRINFQPYNNAQLSSIIVNRLREHQIFHEHALKMCSHKIAAVSGDARRALDICRRAVEIYATSSSKESQITIAHVNQAIDEMFRSKNVAFISNCSFHQKLFLVSLLSVFKQSGIAEAQFGTVADRHISYCKSYTYDEPSISSLQLICRELASSSVLNWQDDRKRNDLFSKVGLKIVENDLMVALKNDESISTIFNGLGLASS